MLDNSKQTHYNEYNKNKRKDLNPMKDHITEAYKKEIAEIIERCNSSDTLDLIYKLLINILY